MRVMITQNRNKKLSIVNGRIATVVQLQKHVFRHVAKFCKQIPNADNNDIIKFSVCVSVSLIWLKKVAKSFVP